MERVVSVRVGLNTRIVNTLREYGEVHVDFLAHLLGRWPSEILESVEYLEREGVIKLKEEKVSLA